MKIRAKVVALLAAVFVALTFVAWVVGQSFLLPRFEEIELDNARTAMKRIDYGVHQALSELEVSASDWGNWKDTYQFMEDRNPQFAVDNLTHAAMKQLGLTAIAFIDRAGALVLAKSVDPATGEPLPIDLLAHGSLPANFAWRENLRTGSSARGLITTERGVLLGALAPVLDGFGQGPARGMVLMGRLLTSRQIAEIGARAQTGVRLVAVRGEAGSAGLLQAGDDLIAINGDVTEVYRAFDDINGEPAMTLRVDAPRTISKGARTTVNYVLAFTLGAAVIVLLILLVALHRTVLSPLARVTEHAVRIGSGDDLTTRLDLRRRDEFGTLATEFDRMVAQVAESRRQHIDDSFQAGMAELSRGVLHNIGNAITPLRVRLTKLRERLHAAPVDDVDSALDQHGKEPKGSPRQADLEEFLRLSAGEMAGTIRQANADVEVIFRQADVVQSALTEQSRSSRSPTVIEAAELSAIIDQTLEIVPDRCRERIRVELDPSVRSVGTVHVARTVLRLVLQNLIINAAEAVRAHGRDRGVVRFSAELVHDDGRHQLRLDCSDDGAGIGAENLERVFEKGYSTKLDQGNMGIGLHWCATAVNALGGRIWATSAGPGHGAVFHLIIPVPRPAARAGSRAA